MSGPIVIESAMLPPSENEMRRTYRHPMAYKRLREAWERALRYGTGSAAKSRAIREAKQNGRMLLEIVVLSPKERDQDNLDAARKVIHDAAKRVGYLVDDSPRYLDCAPVKWIQTRTFRGTLILPDDP